MSAEDQPSPSTEPMFATSPAINLPPGFTFGPTGTFNPPPMSVTFNSMNEAPPTQMQMINSDGEKPRKIGIIGYTYSHRSAPWDDESWCMWGINDLHHYIGDAKWGAWFDLHDLKTIRDQPEHVTWLKSQKDLPVFMWEPQEDFPTSVRFPTEDMCARFPRRYFTNSISWMVAFAITQVEWCIGDGAEIGMWGVDMATGTEYAEQRPSVEYLIGLAEGMGIKVTIAETSDILKSAGLYGGAGNTEPLRAKLTERTGELDERIAELQRQRQAALDQARNLEQGIDQMTGAKETCAYILGTWLPSAHDPSVPRSTNDVRSEG